MYYFCKLALLHHIQPASTTQNIGWPRGGGGTHILRQTGMCHSNGLLFSIKSLNMGPVFYKKILKYGSNFLTELKFLDFRMVKTLKIVKFVKKWVYFSRKILDNGYPFLPK